jgi:hypothetical protein
MVGGKYGLPNGWGRAESASGFLFFDAQFKDGEVHGYLRQIHKGGYVNEYEYENGKEVRKL